MTVRDNWLAGVQSEIDFWRAVFVGEQYPDYKKEMLQRTDPNTPVVEYVSARLPKHTKVANQKILDVAAGPISCIGWKIDGKQPQITPIDALAVQYRAILDEFGIVPPVYTIHCDGEDIRQRFSSNTFDLVHIRNALDHCYDALAVMRNMLDVLKPGGCLIVCGYTDEAATGNYNGLHQWNIRADNNQMIIWRPGVRHEINKLFADQLLAVDAVQDDKNRWTSATLTKR